MFDPINLLFGGGAHIYIILISSFFLSLFYAVGLMGAVSQIFPSIVGLKSTPIVYSKWVKFLKLFFISGFKYIFIFVVIYFFASVYRGNEALTLYNLAEDFVIFYTFFVTVFLPMPGILICFITRAPFWGKAVDS